MQKKRLTLASFVSKEREKLSLSQQGFAKLCNIPAGTIASIESGYAKSPRSVTLKKIADGLKIPFDVIFEFASTPEKEIFVNYETVKIIRLPNLGEIPTEKNLLTLDNAENFISFPQNFLDDGDFLLSVKGDDFMQEDIYDGDYVVVKNQNYLKRSGDLMIIKLNKITIMTRVYKNNDIYTLKTINNSINNDLKAKQDEINFIGKAITSISRKKL